MTMLTFPLCLITGFLVGVAITIWAYDNVRPPTLEALEQCKDKYLKRN